jgi:hypothetical protein
MAERRPLTEGLKQAAPPVDTRREQTFVYGNTVRAKGESAPQAPSSIIARTPISTRIRTDFATALKRASLERQLEGIEPSTLQDILEEAVEPWLKSKGYIS